MSMCGLMNLRREGGGVQLKVNYLSQLTLEVSF
jgi:hypothetical protein